MVATDANGVEMIYPTRTGGHTFISDTNLGSNAQFQPDGTLTHEGSGVYHLGDYSQARWTANPLPNYPQEAIKGTNNDHDADEIRDYAFAKDDWKNVEITAYVHASTWSPISSEFIIKGPTGTHHGPGNGSPDDCSGSSYGVRTGWESQVNSEFFKEEWHVSYYSRGFKNVPTSVHSGSFLDGNWHGIKFMNYEVLVNGKRCRKLEHWLDADGDGVGFVKVNETIDQGGWGSKAGDCGGSPNDQILTWGNGRAMWRTDATSTNLKFKWLSCREIDINGNPDQGSGGQGGGGQGSIMKDGVKAIYPTKTGGFEWYMSDSKPFDGHLEKGGGSDYGNIKRNGDGSWTVDKDGTTKFNIETDPAYQDGIGGCKLDYSACFKRGYSYKDSVDLDHVEMTAFYRMTSQIDHDGIYMRGPCNHHPGSPCCQEYDYDVRVLPKASGAFVVHTKDHPDAANNFPEPGVGKKSITFNPSSDIFFGIKYIHIIVSNDATSPRVRLECYVNTNGDKVTWTKISTAEDFIGKKWGTNSAVCNGEPYQVLAWRSPRMVIKWYNGHIDFTKWSIRQIDPNGTFDEPPPSDGGGTPPPGGGEGPGDTSTIQFSFKLQSDINLYRTTACAGTGISSFYDHVTADLEKKLSDSATWANTTRIGEKVGNSSSPIRNKIIKQVDASLKVLGAPGASPTVSCKIWDSRNNVVYTSPTTIDPTTLTTSFVFTTFDFSTNTHVMTTGDIVGVEWTGTSTTDLVVTGYEEDPNQGNQWQSQYEGTAWTDRVNRDWAAVLYN